MFDGLRIEYMYDTRHRTVRIKLEKDSPRTEYQRISNWVNYNDLTATSLESWVSKGNYPQMALIQVSEIL